MKIFNSAVSSSNMKPQDNSLVSQKNSIKSEKSDLLAARILEAGKPKESLPNTLGYQKVFSRLKPQYFSSLGMGVLNQVKSVAARLKMISGSLVNDFSSKDVKGNEINTPAKSPSHQIQQPTQDSAISKSAKGRNWSPTATKIALLAG